jgi:hypothetical protein
MPCTLLRTEQERQEFPAMYAQRMRGQLRRFMHGVGIGVESRSDINLRRVFTYRGKMLQIRWTTLVSNPDSFLPRSIDQRRRVPSWTSSILVARSIFSDPKSFAFTHGRSGSINHQLEPSMRAGYKRIH